MSIMQLYQMLTLRRFLSKRFQIVKNLPPTIFFLLKVFPLLVINFIFVATNYFIMLHIFPAGFEINTLISFFHIQKWITLPHVI